MEADLNRAFKLKFLAQNLCFKTLQQIKPWRGDWKTHYGAIWKCPSRVLKTFSTGQYEELELHVLYELNNPTENQTWYVVLNAHEGSISGHGVENIDSHYLLQRTYLTTSLEEASEYVNHMMGCEYLLKPQDRREKFEELAVEFFPLFDFSGTPSSTSSPTPSSIPSPTSSSTPSPSPTLRGGNFLKRLDAESGNPIYLFTLPYKKWNYCLGLVETQRGSPYELFVDDCEDLGQTHAKALLSEHASDMEHYWKGEYLTEEGEALLERRTQPETTRQGYLTSLVAMGRGDTLFGRISTQGTLRDQ